MPDKETTTITIGQLYTIASRIEKKLDELISKKQKVSTIPKVSKKPEVQKHIIKETEKLLIDSKALIKLAYLVADPKKCSGEYTCHVCLYSVQNKCYKEFLAIQEQLTKKLNKKNKLSSPKPIVTKPVAVKPTIKKSVVKKIVIKKSVAAKPVIKKRMFRRLGHK